MIADVGGICREFKNLKISLSLVDRLASPGMMLILIMKLKCAEAEFHNLPSHPIAFRTGAASASHASKNPHKTQREKTKMTTTATTAACP